MSKNKRRGHKSKAKDIIGEQSTNENGITHLEASSKKQNYSDGISTAEDTLIQSATCSCQNTLHEEESPENLLTLKPQDFALNPIENHLEENMLEKKKKKKRSKKISTKAVTNLEVVPPEAEACGHWLPSEHQELNMNIEANSSNRKQKTKKRELNIPTSGDVDANTTAQRPLALEVESAANFISLNGQELVLNAMGNCCDKNMPGKKKKEKKSKKNCTEAMISPDVVPSKEESSVRLPAPLPAPELQEDMNIEVNASIGKQEKRKSILNIHTSDDVGVDTTAQQPLLHEVESAAVLHSPKPQYIDLNPMETNFEKNMSGKKKRKKKRSGKIFSDAEVVPLEAEDSLQLPAPGLQDLDAVGENATAQQPLLLEIESAELLLSPKPQDIDSNQPENNLEENMSGKKKRKKKRSGKFSTKAIPSAEVVPPEAEVSLPLPAPGLQDLDIMIEANTSNRIHMGKKSKLNLPPSDVDVDTSFAQQPLACKIESAAILFSPKPQDIGLDQMRSNLEGNMPGKKKKKKKRSGKIPTAANPNPEAVPPKVEDSVQFPAPEFQYPNMAIEVNTSNRKHKGEKSNLNFPVCDVVGVGSTFPQQPLARELETAANLLSPKPHDIVLNEMENHLEGDICGEKNCEKEKKSEIIPTRDIPNLELLSPEAEGYEQLPSRELQGIDVKLETNSSNRKQEKRKKNKVNRPTVDPADANLTSDPQPLASEVESTESLLSLDPQEVVLNPMEEKMAGKKKKRSENASTEVLPNLEVVPSEAVAYIQLPVTELQELDVHIVENNSNRKQKKRKKSKVNTLTGDSVDVDATAPQPLALVVESTANLLSPKPPDVVFDPKNNKVDTPTVDAADVNMTSSLQPLGPDVESTENLVSLESQDVVLIPMEENMAEKKKRSENTSTEVIPNLEVVPSKAMTYAPWPGIECRELDVNIDANSSNRKQKKRKKSKVNTPTCVAVDVDATAPQTLALVVESTANLLSPKPQDVVLDPMDNCMEEHMAGKKNEKSENISTEAISNLEVVPHKIEGSVKLPAPKCQELDVNIEANSSNKKQKKRKKNKVHKPTSDAVEVETTPAPQSHALEHQERATNVTREMEENSSSGIKCSNGEGKKNQHKPTNDAVDGPSAHQPLPLELQEIDKNLTKDLDEQIGNRQNSSSEKRKRRKKKKKNLTSNVIDTKSTGEVLVLPENLERDTLPLIDIEVNNDNGRKRKIEEADVELSAQVIEPENQDLTNKTKRRNVIKGEVDNFKSEEIETLCADTVKMSTEEVNGVSLPTNNALDVENSAMSSQNGVHLAFPEKNTVAESCIEGTRPSSSTGVTMDVNPFLRRKLLILDLNGLLADIIMPPPKGFEPDTSFMRRAVFKRPFCDDFLKFCFERFDLAIWSSRSKRIIDRVVDYLFGNLKHKLLFCWDMSHATMTKFKTLENKDKPLVCKDLRKIWETRYPGLPWKKGDYDESNTLLLDDSPYKALLNPAHTTIFPNSYNFMDKDTDNSLGPGGDLRVYLEKLADAEHVQKFVEQHPFGQHAICEKHPNWDFYSKVMMSLSPRSF